MTVGVHSLTLIEENPAVTAFPPTNKEKQIMTGSEGCNARHTIRYLSADGIETLERCIRRDIQLDIPDNPLELINGFSGNLFASSKLAMTIALFSVCPTSPNTSA